MDKLRILGSNVKGFNIPIDYNSDFGWDVDGKEVGDYEFYSTVAAVFRVINLNSGAVAGMPFALVTESGADFDTSADWKNRKNLFGENPGSLFELWAKSIIFTNTAYGLAEPKLSMRYLVPLTIKPKVDNERGLYAFERKVGNRTTTYPVDGPLVHIFDMDWDVEATPNDSTIYKALCAAAGIAYYSDYYVEEFFKRGAIKPHMLMVKGVLTKEEKERIESVWTKVIRGVRNSLGKVFNADTIDAKPIGSGVDDFKKNEFYKNALANIAMPSGTPLSILLANSANKATAQMEYKSWYDNAVIPMCNIISNGVNQSYYMRELGLRLEFRTKETDPDQEEEQKKSYSFVNYASVFTNNRHPDALSLAAKIVGIDLPEGVDWAYLDKQTEAPEPSTDAPPQDKPPQIKPANDPEAQQQRDAAKFVPTVEQDKELETWKRIAKHNLEKGKGFKVWEPKDLPVDIAAQINTKLSTAETVEDVVKAFVLGEVKTEHDADILALTEAINKLAESNTTPAPVYKENTTESP